MSNERRAGSRHPVNIDARLTFGEEIHSITLANLSLGGALVTGDISPTLGDRVSIEYSIPSLDEPISVGAVVRWITPMSFGLEFDGLRPKQVWSMNKFLEDLTS